MLVPKGHNDGLAHVYGIGGRNGCGGRMTQQEPPMTKDERRLSLVHRIYTTFGTRFRARRMSAFESFAGLTSESTVLDVGGTPVMWNLASVRPRLVLLNLSVSRQSGPPASAVLADGTQLPFRDQSFDLVFSNSVIEHVGDIERQRQFARELTRVGRRFYVQTPNRWFPIEPHVLTPLVHFLPARVRRIVLRNFTIWGLITRPSQASVDKFVRETRLLDAAGMTSMFPQGELLRERFAGLTKSLIVQGPQQM